MSCAFYNYIRRDLVVIVRTARIEEKVEDKVEDGMLGRLGQRQSPVPTLRQLPFITEGLIHM